MDEYWTFALANHPDGIYPVIEDGVAYDADDVYLTFTTAREGHLFDYRMVWENQSQDVHPPFYYVLIHTVCSLFPGQFSPWFGIGVNLVLFVISALLFYQLALRISGRTPFALFALAAYGFSPGIVNAVLFIRMYMLFTIWVLLLLLLFTRFDKAAFTWKFYVPLILISFCGTMTHYYFLIFLLFVCLFFGIRLLVKRRFWETAWFCGSMGLAAGLSIACFPAMIRQIFGGDSRGKEAFESAQHLGDWWNQIQLDFQIINRELFGGFFLLLVIAALVLLIWCARRRFGGMLRGLISPFGWMIGSAVLYFLVVAKVAPLNVDRYFVPIFPILILWTVYAFYEGMRRLSGKRARALVCTGAVVAGCYASSYHMGLPYLYTEKASTISVSAQYDDIPAVYFYRFIWDIIPDYQFLRCQTSVTYYESYHPEKLAGKLSDLPNRMVVYLNTDLDEEAVFEQLFEQNPQLSRREKLFRYDYTDVYLVE